MAVEIDDAVPVPQKQGWTNAPQTANVVKAQEPRQIDLEEAIADTLDDGVDYAILHIRSTVAAVWFNRKTFLVWFVPTEKGKQVFEWQKHLVVPQLLSEFDAARIKHRCGFKDVGADYKEYASIELQLVTEQELMSGGFNYQFDANHYEPSQGGGAHAAGNFEASIASTSVEPNSKGTGGNFVIEFTSEGGSIKKYYSLWHDNPKTVDLAHRQLSALSHATGIYRINMQDGGRALLGARCRIEVGKQPDSEYMEIKKVFDLNGNLPGKGSGNQGGNQGPQGGGFGGGQQNNQQQGGPNQQQNNSNFGGNNQQQNNQQGYGNQGNQGNQQGYGQDQQQNYGNQQQGGPNQGGYGNQQGPGTSFAGGGQPDQGDQGGGWGGGQPQGGNQQQGGGWGGNQGGGNQGQQGGPNQGWQQDQGNQGGNDKPGWAS